jgi:hypothetical protein
MLMLSGSVTGLHAQILVDSARGIVGAEARLPIRYAGTPVDSIGTIAVEGEFLLSNATVFFPERFDGAGRDSLIAWKLTRLTDSTYSFSFTARFDSAGGPAGDTLCYLAGEALAGFDSVCVVRFSKLRVDGDSAADARGTLLTVSVGTPLPYVRFATLERNYPNPIRSGSRTTWAYRIDKPSTVKFHFYNIVGAETFVQDLGEQSGGVHLFSFTPTIETATGMYIVRMETSTGDAYQFMHVIR